jgi:hypothetical protein
MGSDMAELRPTLLSTPLTFAPSLLNDDASTEEITQRQMILVRSKINKWWTVQYWENSSQLRPVTRYYYWQSPGRVTNATNILIGVSSNPGTRSVYVK